MKIAMRRQAMHLTIYMALAVAAGAFGGCGGGMGSRPTENNSVRAERLRLEHALRLDSAWMARVDGGNGSGATNAEGLDDTWMARVEGFDSVGIRSLLDGLTAEAWLLVDDSTGRIISARHADRCMYMASLTKMMTCLLALDYCAKRDSAGGAEADGAGDPTLNPIANHAGDPALNPIADHACDTIDITSDVFVHRDCRVRLGDRYLMGNLIREMMLQSDNDAALALAKHIGGDTLAFCRMMNDKAAYLHMDSTHFANPNGMPCPDNYSTARDLMVLMRYCLRDSAFAAIVGTAEMDIPLADGRHLACENTNLLLSRYEGCIGVKTGYTRQAGACLASAARRNGSTLCLILLNSRTRSSRFSESARLLDFGFRVVAGDAPHKVSSDTSATATA